MNIDAARTNMIKQQLRTCNVLNESILHLLGKVPREQFVPEAYRDLVFADTHIPIGHGQVMFTPLEEALLLEKLAIKAGDRILEIGTGTGYLTALLAQLGQFVHSVDYFADFTEHSVERLARLGIDNVKCITADGAQGLVEQAPYDVIVITAAQLQLPTLFAEQLSAEGRLFAIIGEQPIMRAVVELPKGSSAQQQAFLFDTLVPPMINAVEQAPFVF